MRYMMIVKASKESEAGVMPEEKLIAAMAAYHEELVKAGILVDASGLQASSKGFKVKYSGAKRTVVDGPFTEAKELIAGYTIIRVKSKEEAIAWAKRFPNPHGEGTEAEIEVRRFFELEDFAPSEAVERFQKMDLPK
ncbi:MAG: YciI family protein [Nitrospirae bacterium]|nr:YciI family protein [Candidatus Manganitrophaceae bacterium]